MSPEEQSNRELADAISAQARDLNALLEEAFRRRIRVHGAFRELYTALTSEFSGYMSELSVYVEMPEDTEPIIDDAMPE